MPDPLTWMDFLTESAPEKRDGFSRQKIFFAPEELKRQLARHPMAVGLHAIHLGMFPSARHHAVHRPQGIGEAVLIYCHRGRGFYETGGVAESLEAGEVLFLSPGTPHRYAADAKAPWSIYWAHFSGTVLPPLFAHLPQGTFKVSLSDTARRELLPLFQKSLRLLENGHGLQSALAVSHFLRAMIGCCFFLGYRTGPPRHGEVRSIERAIRLMQENPARTLSLPELARSVHLSPSRFSALFRSRTGTSPVRYHLRLRMQNACQLLDSSPSDIQEIADRCGYPDPYYFSRLFKKVTGKSPTEYRREPRTWLR